MSFSSAPTRRYFLAGAGGMMLSRSAWAQAPAATVVGLPELPYQKSKLIHGLRWLNEPQHLSLIHIYTTPPPAASPTTPKPTATSSAPTAPAGRSTASHVYL